MPDEKSDIPYQPFFDAEEYRRRWERIYDAIGDGAVAVVQGMALSDGFSYPRQNSEFYYLCGVETPHAYLLLDGRNRLATLYLPERDARTEAAEGRVLSASDRDFASAKIGVDDVRSKSDMTSGWLTHATLGPPNQIYACFAPSEGNCQARHELLAHRSAVASDDWDGRVDRALRFIELLRCRYPKSEIVDLTPILDQMRSVKSRREIDLIRYASQVAGHAVIQAIRSTQPGLHEYHLNAVAKYIFQIHGCRLDAYRPICACGPAIWNMHYYRNAAPLIDGELVLLDYAPEFGCYCSDITRVWPVNGRFSDTQRVLLQFVLEYRNAIMGRLRPGVHSSAIRAEAKSAMEAVFRRTRFSKPCYENAAHKLVESGGGVFSHPVGLAVHDDGPYDDGPLRPGHVFSIDPQIWVPEEKLYLRYEDVVAITEDGFENFTDFLPTELDEIEALVGQAGVIQMAPPVLSVPTL